MIIDLPPALRAHMWVALGAYVRQLRRDGCAVPDEVADLYARLGRDAERDALSRRRGLSAARSRRYRKRKTAERRSRTAA
jgi:hypothetical protein